MLTGRDLRKSFAATAALRGASIEVREGEIVAVMGPSGSPRPRTMSSTTGSRAASR